MKQSKNKVTETKIEKVDVQMTQNRNREGFESDRILPNINYIPLSKWVRQWSQVPKRSGTNIYDNEDGRIRHYYATPFRPEIDGLQITNQVISNNQYFEWDYVWEEEPAGTFTLYQANKDNITSPGVPIINPADWDPVNVIEWLFPNQIEYGYQKYGGWVFVSIPPSTPTYIPFGDVSSAKYSDSLTSNDEYIVQTHGVFVISYQITREDDLSGTYRRAQLEIDWNIIDHDTRIPLDWIQTVTKWTYHVRLNSGSIVKLLWDHNWWWPLAPENEKTYLFVTRAS